MRLTVGPLPPAVYWRRRAIVLGAVLLFVWVIAYSCSGMGKTATSSGSSPEPTVSVHTPTSDPPSSDASGEEPTGKESPSAEPTEEAAAPTGGEPGTAEGTCSDDEILVTPVPALNPVQRGVTIELMLRIKNISNRTCDRDVGADAQEIYITLGAEKIWSSDTCGTAEGSDVKSIPPGLEQEFRVAWNGKASTSCAKGVATGDPLSAGEYQLIGRLGTKHSEPVLLTITN